jgi:hypothetical protein
MINKVIIYGQRPDLSDANIEEMKDYIQSQKWSLIEGIIDYEGSSEGLFNLLEKLKGINIVLIYSKKSISDEFSLNLLYQTARTENVEILEYK